MQSKILYNNEHITLPCKFSLIPEIIIKKQKYFSKNEFHISLVCVKKYAPILSQIKNISLEESTKQITKTTKKFFVNHTVKFDRLLKDIRVANRDERSSVIIRVKLFGMNNLNRFLVKNLGLKIENPPVHVTLYTLADGKGIGINDKNDIKKLTTPLRGKNKIVANFSILSYRI